MTAKPTIQSFFDEATFTVTYLVSDPETKRAAVIDPVLDFEPKSGPNHDALGRSGAQGRRGSGPHDRLDPGDPRPCRPPIAAAYLKEKTGARVAIGEHITDVQKVFRPVFNAKDVMADGAPFDRLLKDGEHFAIGELDVEVMHTPGHTPACVSYRIGDNVFVGDTLFMPDYGTARADFPGGDARTLYRSIRQILSLPDETVLWMCHDYLAPGRDTYAWKTTVAEERAKNVHIHDGVSEDEFVAMREARDKTLAMPVLILPSVQVNIRAGHFPPPEDDGQVYLKLPVNLGSRFPRRPRRCGCRIRPCRGRTSGRRDSPAPAPRAACRACSRSRDSRPPPADAPADRALRIGDQLLRRPVGQRIEAEAALEIFDTAPSRRGHRSGSACGR